MASIRVKAGAPTASHLAPPVVRSPNLDPLIYCVKHATELREDGSCETCRRTH